VRWLTGRRIPHSFEGGARKVPSLLPLQVTSQGPGVSLGKEGLLLEQFKAPMTPANHIRYREQKEEDLGWGGVGVEVRVGDPGRRLTSCTLWGVLLSPLRSPPGTN
jgi:hypothetical protein